MTDFTRYLFSKRSIDDRALNHDVWQALTRFLQSRTTCRVLELGAGVGTMVDRLVDQGVLPAGSYCLLDSEPDLLRVARRRLGDQLADTALQYQQADFRNYVAQAARSSFDLIIAHAFLDLIHLPVLLPQLMQLLSRGGAFYFTLNFDGSTIIQPSLDPDLDDKIEQLYHQTMDDRCVNGQPAGDSRTGRNLLQHLREAGATVTAAGSSDWVVFAGPQGYPDDEAFFLEYILQTMEKALSDHIELADDDFSGWLAQRRHQLATGELYYIAHQIDYFGFYGV